MLYLITGKPGSGKTLHMMSMLLKRKDLRDRPLYIDGIPDVDPEKIPHEALPEGCTEGYTRDGNTPSQGRQSVFDYTASALNRRQHKELCRKP